MKSIEKSLSEGFESKDDVVFNTSDEELINRAVKTVNVQNGSKDLLTLGMASIWVVFASIFTKILTPIFKNMAHSNNNERK